MVALEAHDALRNTPSFEINSAVLSCEFAHIAIIASAALSHFSEAIGLR